MTSRPSHEGDRSWGAPSWGSFGEGAPTAVGGQVYLGPYHGEYFYPSDSYRPHLSSSLLTFWTRSLDFVPSFPFSANSETDFSVFGDVGFLQRVRSLCGFYGGALFSDQVYGGPKPRCVFCQGAVWGRLRVE